MLMGNHLHRNKVRVFRTRSLYPDFILALKEDNEMPPKVHCGTHEMSKESVRFVPETGIRKRPGKGSDSSNQGIGRGS